MNIKILINLINFIKELKINIQLKYMVFIYFIKQNKDLI